MAARKPTPLPPEERLGYHIKKAEHTILTAKGNRLKALGLTVPQYAALLTLRDHPGISGAALAERCLTTPQTMAAQLKVMTQAGWIERTPSQWAKNATETRLTPAGQELLMQAEATAGALEQRLYDALTEQERQQLTALLEKCVQAVG